MDVSSINNFLQLIYTYIPQELLIIILACLVSGIFFKGEDEKKNT